VGDYGAVGTRITRGEVHLAAAVANHGRALSNRKGKWLKQLNLVTALCQAGADTERDGFLHLDITTFERLLGETGLFKCSLDVHAKIHDVGNKLRVGLRLIPAAHNAKADVNVALLHEGGDDGMERTAQRGVLVIPTEEVALSATPLFNIERRVMDCIVESTFPT
jgi:hypothetical protein